MYKLICIYNKQDENTKLGGIPEVVFTIYLNDMQVTQLQIWESFKVTKIYDVNNILVQFNDMNGATNFVLKDNVCSLELTVAGGCQGMQSLTSSFRLSSAENAQFVEELNNIYQYLNKTIFID
jgi:hypothetical protein